MPRVSVITATYNRPEVLRWAMESVRRQTYGDWEHIIVGDACEKETEALVRSFDEPRVRYFNREQNFGEQSGPNNDGLALARGELITFLNHDDLWFPDHLATLVAVRDELGADPSTRRSWTSTKSACRGAGSPTQSSDTIRRTSYPHRSGC